MIRITLQMFIIICGLHAYVYEGYGLFDDKPGTTIVAANYVPTFNDQVGEWAEEITEATPPVQVSDTEAGNCLPVALELQKRIVATGRSAIIVAVAPPTGANHALVLYASKPGGRFDYVIDNGFSTAWVAQPRELLNNGTFGKYYATCKDPVASTGTCQRLGLPI